MLRCSANCLQCYQKPNDTLCKLKSVFRKLFETDEQLQTQAKKIVGIFIHSWQKTSWSFSRFRMGFNRVWKRFWLQMRYSTAFHVIFYPARSRDAVLGPRN